MLCGVSNVFGQVTINTANGSVNSCTYPTNYVGLGDIFLEENQNGNFNIILQNFDYTLIITAPTNFEFRPGTGSVSFRGTGDITAASINVTATTITVTYRSSDGTRTNNDDRLTISGIEFRGITAPSTGNMTRTALGGGTGTISDAAGGSIYGSLTSTNNPLPANGGGAATVCVGSSTPAFTNATGSGAWSVIPGTGTATVTVGGVVTGTSAGTVTVRYTVNGCIANSALTVNPTPAAIGGGAATVCTGASTPAFTNAVGGGTWSVIPGTGTASITGGGVLTGTTAGTVTVRYTLPAGCFVNSAVVTIQQTPGAIAGGAATVCVGASTPAFTNPNAGGTWSVVNGTGTATITGGGVLTGTSPGNVTVRYTIGTCTPATFNVTVNPTPTAIGGGAATVCVGGTTPAFTNAGGGGTWSITNGTGSATISTSGVVTGVTAGGATVVYAIGSCSVTRAITITTVPVAAGSPTPINGATGVCYAGSGAVTSISWGVVAGATSYDVYFGAGSVPATVTANVATNTYNTGALAANTTYYWRIVAKNACGGAPTSATFSFTTSTMTCYCLAGGSNANAGSISNVNFNTIDRFSGFDGYINTGLTTTVTKTIAYNLSVSKNILNTYNTYTQAWIDWNQDGDFADAGEIVMPSLSSAVAGISTRTVSVTVPAGAVTGNTRMRVMMKYNAASATNGCDISTTYMDVEDYYINVQPIAACVAPTTQPTALVLTPSGTTIGGSFAPAVPNPTNYLVVRNTTGTAPPAPLNGTNYVIGGTLGTGNIIVDNDNNTNFVATGLTTTSTYYFFIYSFNSICTGGPLYNSTAPLTGNTTTTTADPTYCPPSVGVGYESLVYFSNISFVGTLNDISNSSTYSSAPRGYQDFSSIANRSRQAQGQGVNISTQTSSRGYMKAWVDWNRDGDFLDAGELVYDVGGIASYSTTFGFIIPAAQPVGNYRVRIRINKDDNIEPYDAGAISTFDSCQNIDYNGETEDYTFTVIASCSAVITGVTNGVTCGPGTVNLAATSTGEVSQYRWYANEFGGTPLATTATGSWTTTSISSTTTYWVTGFNGCESLVRTKVTARVNPLATITFTPSIPEVCGENNVLSLTAAGDIQQTYLIDEKFNAGLGVMSNVNIVTNGGAVDALSAWQNRTSTFVPAQQVWFPAIASGMNGNKFALATSDTGQSPVSPNPVYITHNAIQSPTVITNTYLDLTLSFDIFYSRYYVDNSEPTLDYVTVDVSTNEGTSWTEIDRYLTDQGYGTRFVNKTYNLNAYINQPKFRVRVRYYGEWCDGLAIDNFQLYGNVPLNTSFDWTAASPVAAFTDAACTTAYVTGTPITTVYVRPTLLELEEPTYSFTATAVLSNGCSVSQAVSINNKSKVWKGGTNGDWSVANNWLPVGVPDATNCVIIPPATNNALVSGTNVNGYGKTLQVINGGNLTIHPSNTLTITDFVEVRGATSVFDIENSASLIQINNVANSGIISMKRNATIKALDYVYWSSPVASFASSAISPLTSTGLIWKWEPTTLTGYANQFGNWVNGNEAMTIGRGYIVRSPSGWPTANTTFTANFVGVPNNGTILRPITRWTYTGDDTAGPTGTLVTEDDDNWNLLGNPYPSAIDADAFISTNITHLHGFVDLWTHGASPAAIADPFYQDYQLNYNPNDYLRYNHLGSTKPGFYGKIGAGQGFFVLMTDAGTMTEVATFNNTMRSKDHRNDQFFRTTATTTSSIETIERHRIWMKLIAPSGLSSDMLVGYATGATNSLDATFDAMNKGVKVNYELYSLAENQGLLIQGRSLPFDTNDQIPLGVKIAQNGIHTIAISAADGLFGTTTQDIYLEDLVLGITHDLRTAPYTFTAAPGRYENRFVLKFNNETLGTNDLLLDEASVWVFSDHSLTVKSSKNEIQSVRVFDLLGRALAHYPNANSMEVPLTTIQKNDSGLIIQVTLSNGTVVTKKTIY